MSVYNYEACIAARNGNVKLLGEMINNGANYWDCIAEEAAECGHIEIVKSLISGVKGKDGKVVGSAKDINSIACYAAKGGYPNIVYTMIKMGANSYDDILCNAVKGCSKEVVCDLIIKGHNRWLELSKCSTNNRKYIMRLISKGVEYRVGIIYKDILLLFLDDMLYCARDVNAKKEIEDLALDITVGVNYFVRLDHK